MEYFKNFPRVDYRFGDDFVNVGGADTVFEVTQNISIYTEILDAARKNGAFYSKYYVLEGDRPDVVSQKIYGTPAYHWTFYLMNDHLREQGWPLSNNEIDEKIKKDFPHKYIQTRDDLTGVFLPAQRAYGAQSAGAGVIMRRHLDLGVVVIDSVAQFLNGEKVSNATYAGNTASVTVASSGFEYDAPRYYVQGADIVDIDPAIGPGALLTPVTNYDYYVQENDKLKEINVLRPDAANQIVGTYLQTIGNG